MTLERKPIVINITGTNGKSTVAKILYEVFIKLGYKVGFAGSMGLYANGKLLLEDDRSGIESYDYLYTNRDNFDFIICENVLKNIKAKRFYKGKADFCIITNIEDDHKHQTVTNSVQEIAEIKSRLISQNKENGIVILNSDNNYTPFIIETKKPSNIILFSLKENSSRNDKLKNFYYRKDNQVRDLNDRAIISNIKDIPFTYNGNLTFNISNLLASVAVLDNISFIKKEEIESKLKEIHLSYGDLPGRFNIIPFKNFTVILDKAHNPNSYLNVFNNLENFPRKRLVTLLKASSTRSAELINEIGKIAAQYSDYIYIKESFAPDSPKKEKLAGTIAQKLYESLENANFNMQNVKVILDEIEATEYAIRNAKNGDLIIIFGYRTKEIYKEIYMLRKLDEK